LEHPQRRQNARDLSVIVEGEAIRERLQPVEFAPARPRPVQQRGRVAAPLQFAGGEQNVRRAKVSVTSPKGEVVLV